MTNLVDWFDWGALEAIGTGNGQSCHGLPWLIKVITFPPNEREAVLKIKGLNAITKKMGQLAKFAGELDGEVAKVSFDPHDPASIENAIQELNAAVDAKAASYGRNDWVENVANQLKEQGRAAIISKAEAARLEGTSEQ